MEASPCENQLFSYSFLELKQNKKQSSMRVPTLILRKSGKNVGQYMDVAIAIQMRISSWLETYLKIIAEVVTTFCMSF